MDGEKRPRGLVGQTRGRGPLRSLAERLQPGRVSNVLAGSYYRNYLNSLLSVQPRCY